MMLCIFSITEGTLWGQGAIDHLVERPMLLCRNALPRLRRLLRNRCTTHVGCEFHLSMDNCKVTVYNICCTQVLLIARRTQAIARTQGHRHKVHTHMDSAAGRGIPTRHHMNVAKKGLVAKNPSTILHFAKFAMPTKSCTKANAALQKCAAKTEEAG